MVDYSSGMGFDQLVLYQDNPALFGSLTAGIPANLTQAFNPNVKGSLTSMLNDLSGKTPEQINELVNAITDIISQRQKIIDDQVNADLAAQQTAFDRDSKLSLTDAIVSSTSGDRIPPLLELIAGPALKEILHS